MESAVTIYQTTNFRDGSALIASGVNILTLVTLTYFAVY